MFIKINGYTTSTCILKNGNTIYDHSKVEKIIHANLIRHRAENYKIVMREIKDTYIERHSTFLT